MKVHTFEAHKQGIAGAMRETLTMSKALNRPLKSYCTKVETKEVRIYLDNDGNDGKSLNELLQEVEALRQIPNATLAMSGRTRASGRFDYFDCVIYTASIKVMREEITDRQIEDAMRTLVKKHMGLKPYNNLDCRVMGLYKEGAITWEEAIKSIKTDCKI